MATFEGTRSPKCCPWTNQGHLTFQHTPPWPRPNPWDAYTRAYTNRGDPARLIRERPFDVDTNPLTCCCGGQGLIRQVIKGDGMAFIGAMGVITHKTLAPGETLLVDTNSLVSCASSAFLSRGLPTPSSRRRVDGVRW